jgi:nucleoside-diphosphate-sugar epimerase
VARALIVGCGCRGRDLGRRLIEAGWAVRGTTRDPARCEGIEAAGIEAAVADPDRAITILEAIEGVAVVCWLLGSAEGEDGALAAMHGPRLERLLEELVDTPVRGVVYESAGTVAADHLRAGERALREARERWRIPFELIAADPADNPAWGAAAETAVERVVA